MTEWSAVLPYFHPTTAILVDDSKLFTKSLQLRIPTDLAIETIEDAREALERISETSHMTPLTRRCVTPAHLKSDGDANRLELDLGRIEEEVYFADRYRRVSVVVVDYGMPAMNGFEFCRRVNDPTIKKILLTGVADRGLAVEALASGTVDGYLAKSDKGVFPRLWSLLRELQRQHFEDQRTSIEAFSERYPEFLNDPAIGRYLNSIQSRLEIVEHYVVDRPSGLLMLNACGDAFRLAVWTDEDMDRQEDLLRNWHAPEETAMAVRKRLRGLFLLDGEQACPRPASAERLVDIVAIRGARPWYLGLRSKIPRLIDLHGDQSKSCFSAHIEAIGKPVVRFG